MFKVMAVSHDKGVMTRGRGGGGERRQLCSR